MPKLRLFVLSALLLTGLVVLFSLPVAAQEQTPLTVNQGSASDDFTIRGEQSLVMNGFDLTPMNVLRPASVISVSIDVVQPVPETPSELVIYQDINGGSPADATLLYRQSVQINQSGTVTINIAQPPIITAPVVWIGFYLPVGFRFNADQSGSSVLTYWGWTPGGTFDLANLGSAQVFGPGDGRAPVSIDMDGKARITALVHAADPSLGTPVILQAHQVTSTESIQLTDFIQYENCIGFGYDAADEYIATRNSIDLHCTELPPWHAPPAPTGYTLRGNKLFSVIIYGDEGENITYVLNEFITHCLAPDANDVNSAVLGVAYGSPLVWRILPTVRYANNLICAELPHAGHVAYFTANNAPTAQPSPQPTAGS